MVPPRPRLPRRTSRERRREPVPGPVEGSVIRPAVPSDGATIVALRALMFEAMGTPAEQISDPTWQEDASRWLQAHLADEHTHVVVAEANGTVVSCAIGQVLDLMPSPTRAGEGGLITNIATFPRHRRLGFTHAVLASLLEWFEEETEVEVITLNATEAGRDIYVNYGFEPSTFPEMRLRLERGRPDDEPT